MDTITIQFLDAATDTYLVTFNGIETKVHGLRSAEDLMHRYLLAIHPANPIPLAAHPLTQQDQEAGFGG